MDKAKKIIFGAVLLVLLASCSQVFEAGISGKVVTPRGTSTAAVADVNVFAYTDKGRRDSDFAKFQSGTITRPTEGAGYVATTSTNANGQFTVNKVVWETHRSEFGKTADVSRLYLIFYHEDYKPAKYDATIISGSTNADNVYVELEGNKDYTTVNITVLDVSTGLAMADPCTLEYKVGDSGNSDTVVMTGQTTIRVSYLKGSNPNLSMTLTSPGTKWIMTKSDGSPAGEPEKKTLSDGSLSITLYMKNLEITLPAFSGDIDGSITSEEVNENDNLPIRLGYYKNDESIAYFEEVEEAQLKTHSTIHTTGVSLMYEHGRFENVGSSGSYSIRINAETYPDMGIVIGGALKSWSDVAGKTITVRLHFEFGSKVCDIDYSPRTSAGLGHIETT